MNRYLFVAIFCVLSAKTSAQAPPAFRDLSKADQSNARLAFNTMGELPRLRRQPNKRWEMAIHWATHEGNLEPWMWEEVFWDVDKDGNLFDKIKMKLWWKIDHYVYTTLRIIAKIAMLIVAWPLAIKIYRAFRPKKVDFSAELSEDKQIVYIGESVNLTLSYDVGSEEDRYKLEPVEVGDKAHINRIGGSGDYLKGKGQVRYTYTPVTTEAWLPTFTIRDTKGRQGIGLKNNKYVGNLWYIEPSGGSIILQPTLSIRAVDWDLGQDENASTENRVVIDIKPTDNTVGREDRQMLVRQDYEVRVKEVRGFNHTNRLRVSQNQGKITVDGIDKMTVPLGASEDVQQVNPSVVIEVSHLDEIKEVEIPLSETYQRMVVNPEPRRTNPADFFTTALERQRYDEARGKDNPLIYAAGKGYLTVVKFYKERIGEDINETDTEGKSPLYHAVKNNKGEVIDYIRSKGGSKVAVDDTLKSKIEEAIENDDANKMSMYIKACEGVLSFNCRWGNTPLHFAAYYNSVGVARLLLEAGANKDARAIDNETPLHFAVYEDSVGVARLLLEAGANKDARAIDNETPLHYAAYRNSVEVARLLLEAGANKDARNRFNHTPLHGAAYYNSVGVATLLAESGAQKIAVDDTLKGKIREAIQNDDANKMSMYIKACEGVLSFNLGSGNTPLHYAAYRNSVEVARLLLEAGANKEARNSDNNTPLHKAAYYNSVGVATLLAESGAQKVTINNTLKRKIREAIENDDANKMSMYIKACEGVLSFNCRWGYTPLHYAAYYNSVGVARLLLEAGANKAARNHRGYTPLSIAENPLFNFFTTYREQNQQMINLLQS